MNRWRAQNGLVVALDNEGYAVVIEKANDVSSLTIGNRLSGSEWSTPAKCQNNLHNGKWTLIGEPTSEKMADGDYRIAIKDANAQGILKTFIVELHILMTDYDMHDSIFGEQVQKLIKTYETDMRV